MMKIRFGDGFVIEFAIEDASLSLELPQFALQLLVENAIKHNRVSVKSPLRIAISATDDSLQVSNNYQPKTSSSKGYGIGLANLSKRYELLGKPPIEISKNDQEFSVTIGLS